MPGNVAGYFNQQRGVVDAATAARNLAHQQNTGQVLQQPPSGGPMSFAPPPGQPPRGNTINFGGYAPPPGRAYTPNPFIKTPPQATPGPNFNNAMNTAIGAAGNLSGAPPGIKPPGTGGAVPIGGVGEVGGIVGPPSGMPPGVIPGAGGMPPRMGIQPVPGNNPALIQALRGRAG